MADDVSSPHPKKRLSLSGAIALVGGASYFSLGLGILRGVLYTRLLPSPESRGIVGIVFLAITYLTHLHLGIIDGVTKRIPVLLGQGRDDDAETLERAGITAVFFLSLFGASLMWVYAVLATGSDLKNTVCVTRNGQAFLSQHDYRRLIDFTKMLEIIVRLGDRHGWL